MVTPRPQDIGEQFPGAIPALQPVHEGMAPIDYGTKPDVNEALTPVNIPTTSTELNPLIEFSVAIIAAEYLICREVIFIQGVEQLSTILSFIAKPIELRASNYDTDGDEDDDGFIVTALTGSRRSFARTRNGNTLTYFEDITTAYTVGGRVFAIKAESTGVDAAPTYQDVNADARRWINIEPATKYFAVEQIHRDTLQCVEWDYDTKAPKLDANDVVLPSVEVAKAYSLRGTVWSKVHNGGSENPDGVDYTANADDDGDDHKDRLADDDSVTENQEVIPPWFNTGNGVWVTIIRATRVDAGTGAIFNNIQSIWQDTNDDGRAFAEKFS